MSFCVPDAAWAGGEWSARAGHRVRFGSSGSGTFGDSTASGDLNGDAFVDIVVGEPGYGSGAGAVHGVITHPSLNRDLAWTIDGFPAGAVAGSMVSLDGDFNNDGAADLLVGAPGTSTGAGSAYVFYGPITASRTASSADIVVTHATANARFDSSAAFGDFDGDGAVDVALGAPTSASAAGPGAVYAFDVAGFSTASTTSGADYTIFGATGTNEAAGSALVTVAGRVGVGDVLVVGAPKNGPTGGGSTTGAVYALALDSSQATYTTAVDYQRRILPSAPGLGMGTTLSRGPSQNADSVLVGAATKQVWLFNDMLLSGGATVDETSAAAVFRVFSSTSPPGDAHARVLDFNGDGYEDILVAYGPFSTSPKGFGAVFLVQGPSFPYSGTFNVGNYGGGPDDFMTVSDEGTAFAGDAMGTSVAVGDFNADGLDDFVASAPGADDAGTDHGLLGTYVSPFTPRFGSFDGADATASVQGPAGGDGVRLVEVGDINGDGAPDLAMSDPGHDRAPQSDVGAVYFFWGPSDVEDGVQLSTTALDPANADWVVEGFFSDDRLGGSVIRGAGDLDEDGCDDVLIGIPGVSGSGGDVGQVAVFYGGGSLSGTTVVSTSSAALFEGTQAFAEFGADATGIGDFNRDGFQDIAIGSPAYDHTNTDDGVVFVIHGSSSRFSGRTTVSPTSVPFAVRGNGAGARAGAALSPEVRYASSTDPSLVLGSPGAPVSGMVAGGLVAIFNAPRSGVVRTIDADDLLRAGQPSQELGVSIDRVPDLDGDGFDDLVVGDIGKYYYGRYMGTAFWVPGNTRGGPGSIFDLDVVPPALRRRHFRRPPQQRGLRVRCVGRHVHVASAGRRGRLRRLGHAGRHRRRSTVRARGFRRQRRRVRVRGGRRADLLGRSRHAVHECLRRRDPRRCGRA